MELCRRDGMSWLKPRAFRALAGIAVKSQPDDVLFVKGGDERFYDRFLSLPMFEGLTPVVPRQVHGADVLVVAGGPVPKRPQVDGVATDRRDVVLTISVADCVPLYLVGATAVALVHAGWRGAAAGIARNAVAAMGKLGDGPDELSAWVGPCAGAGRYEVGPEVASRFSRSVLKPSRDGRFLLDLAGAVADDLVSAGVSRSRIASSGLCTISHPALLHSYRIEGRRCGQMLGFLALERENR